MIENPKKLKRIEEKIHNFKNGPKLHLNPTNDWKSKKIQIFDFLGKNFKFWQSKSGIFKSGPNSKKYGQNWKNSEFQF